MLRDTAIARVKQMLGFKTNLDAEIVQAMIEVQQQQEREKELPGFLRKKFSSFATVANQKSLAVPTDFIKELDDDQLFAVDVNGAQTSVVKDQEGFLRLRFPVSDETGLLPSIPRRYAIVDRTYYFYPTPDAIYSLNGTYYAHDALLSTNIENKWLLELPELIMGRAGLLISAALRDKDAIAFFGTMAQVATVKLNEMTVAGDAAGSKPVAGGED